MERLTIDDVIPVHDFEVQSMMWRQIPSMVIDKNTRKIVIANAALETLTKNIMGGLAGKSLDVMIPDRLQQTHWKRWDDFWDNPATTFPYPVVTNLRCADDSEVKVVIMAYACVLSGRTKALICVIPTTEK